MTVCPWNSYAGDYGNVAYTDRCGQYSTMKSVTVLTILILIIFSAYGQNYEPQILILAPNETTFDKKFDKEITKINSDLSNRPKTEGTKSNEFTSQPENIRLMTLSEIKFSDKMDFFRQTSFFAHQYLSYRFYERFTNLLILLSDNKSKGELNDLKVLADNEKVQYVLNFPKIDLYQSNGVAYSKIKVQLYDNRAGEYLINKDFEGDWRNPGFEFACQDKTIHCTINNALSSALAEVIQVIATNSPTLKRERELSRQRYDELIENHLTRPSNVEPLKAIIQGSSDLSLENVFQVLYDHSKTKFVAFSVEQVSAQDFKDLKDNKKDKNVSIITSKDIKDKGFLNEIPQTYAFIIKGVKHNDQWYYEKSNATYFEVASLDEGKKIYFNNLQKWDFFIENTTMLNPNFWETALFEKVPDLKKNPDWEKYGDSVWKTDEANNRGYVGLYEIVANVIRTKKREENEKFEKATKDEKLKPKYEQLKNNRPKEFTKYSEHSLIYSSDRQVVINPVLITNDKGIHTLHYFVALSNSDDLYEWTYFPTEELKNSGFFGSNVVDRISTITEWNFSYDNLDDKAFWDSYVLRKEGDKFKYLKKVQL
jgi:hypothetical protein